MGELKEGKVYRYRFNRLLYVDAILLNRPNGQFKVIGTNDRHKLRLRNIHIGHITKHWTVRSSSWKEVGSADEFIKINGKLISKEKLKQLVKD